jgi:cell division protein FtsW
VTLFGKSIGQLRKMNPKATMKQPEPISKTAYLRSLMAGDYQLWCIVLFLNGLGFLVQFSAKSKYHLGGALEPISYLIKTGAILVISLVIMSYISRQDYVKLTRWNNLFLLASWLLIGFAYVFGPSKGGASRWIDIGPISFMPSDMAKLALIISLSKLFATKQSGLKEYNTWTLVIILIQVGITCFLIMLSNFSTSILIGGTSFVLMLFGRVPWRSIGIVVGVLVGLGFSVVVLGIGQRAETVQNRIKSYIKRTMQHESGKQELSEKDDAENYQLHQSQMAIATGALQPLGPGKSQFRYLLSQADSDFIYATVLEEYGLIMGLFLPFVYLWLLMRGIRVIQFSAKPLGGLLSAGLSFSIVVQAFINMFVSVGAIPVTGQPMPMISAGGTSLIFTAISMGLIMSISRDKDLHA